jgi:hypothetical protein
MQSIEPLSVRGKTGRPEIDDALEIAEKIEV